MRALLYHCIEHLQKWGFLLLNSVSDDDLFTATHSLDPIQILK